MVGHTAVVLPHRHGEPAQLLQLKAEHQTEKQVGFALFSVHQFLLVLYSLPVLSTGVMNHVDEDGRPDFLKGADVKLEPGEKTEKLRR